MKPVKMPDLTKRPHNLSVEREMEATPEKLYQAWTQNLDQWFAAPGSVLMKEEVNTAFFFETEFDGNRHPHYGRFLKLEPNQLIEITWITGEGGTKGAETVVRVDLQRVDNRTLLQLSHNGFPDEVSMNGHKAAWPSVLEILDQFAMEQ